jgi:hypothetical protein
MEPNYSDNIQINMSFEKENPRDFMPLSNDNNLTIALKALRRAILLNEEQYLHESAFIIRRRLNRRQRCWLAATALYSLDYEEFTSVTDRWWEDQQRKNFFHDV